MKNTSYLLNGLFGILCVATSFSLVRNIPDWQITGKWICSLAIITFMLLIISLELIFHKQQISCLNIKICSAWFVSTNIVTAIYCILQISGLATNSTPYRAVADFDNPAGVASFLCLTFPFSITVFGHRWRTVSVFVTFVFDTLVLFIIQSRSGLITISLSLLLGLSLFMRKKNEKQMIMVAITVFAIVLGIAFLSYKKQKSTAGRMVIYKTCMNMLANRPDIGYGPDVFAKYYMKYQAEYLKTIENDKILMLSDNVTHPLSEYLLIVVNYGIVGLAFIMAIIIVCLHMISKQTGSIKTLLFMIVCTLVVLSLFSYPFRYPITLVTTLFCAIILFRDFFGVYNSRYRVASMVSLSVLGIISLCFVISMQFAMMAWQRMIEGEHHSNLKDSKQLIINKHADCVFKRNARYLFSRAVSNYDMKYYNNALIDAKNSADYLSCYDTELLLGSIYSHIGMYAEAQRHYREASYMCPSRIAPLYWLFRLYEEQQDTTMMLEYGEKLLDRPVKVQSHETRLMRLDVKRSLLNIEKKQ